MNCKIFQILLLIFLIVVQFDLLAKPSLKFSKSIKYMGYNQNLNKDTMNVSLNVFAEGDYDTVWNIVPNFDTVIVSVDLLFGVDLSYSMLEKDSTNTTRLGKAKRAILNFVDQMRPGDRIGLFGWTGTGSTLNLDTLADTSATHIYFSEWIGLTDNIDSVRNFLHTNLTIGNDSIIKEVSKGGREMLISKPPFDFGGTPLNLSTFHGMHYVSNITTNSKKVFVQLTDGENNDGVNHLVLEEALRNYSNIFGSILYTVGFFPKYLQNTQLQRFAIAGGGKFYNVLSEHHLYGAYSEILKNEIISSIDTNFTTVPILVEPDTIRNPIDILLAFDLSGSMKELDNTTRWRITWAQISALNFLDNLQDKDRVGIFGWTSTSTFSDLADTSDVTKFYEKWFPYSSDFNTAKSFIRDSLFLDGDTDLNDSYNNETLAKQKFIPGNWGDTPLNSSITMALKRVASQSNSPNKAVIVITDGENRDNLSNNFVKAYADSIYNATGISLYTIGFNGGDMTILKEFAQAGGGSFFKADNPSELDSIYNDLSNIVFKNFAAKNLIIKDALDSNQTYIIGSQEVLSTSSVGINGFNTRISNSGRTILEWNAHPLPVFGTTEIQYKVTVPKDYNGNLQFPTTGGQLSDDDPKISFVDINDNFQEIPLMDLNSKNLDLGFYNIDSLDSKIGDYSKLIELNLSNNKLTGLPLELGLLNKLEILDVSNNELLDLPSTLGMAGNIKVLNLANNKLSNLNSVVGLLVQLESLDISNNNISQLPPNIFELINIRINVDGNNLCNIDQVYSDWLDLHATSKDWRARQFSQPGLNCDGQVEISRKSLKIESTKLRVLNKKLYLSFQNTRQKKLAFYSMRGELKFTKEFSETNHEIDLKKFNSGIYYLTIISKGLRITKKIVL